MLLWDVLDRLKVLLRDLRFLERHENVQSLAHFVGRPAHCACQGTGGASSRLRNGIHRPGSRYLKWASSERACFATAFLTFAPMYNVHKPTTIEDTRWSSGAWCVCCGWWCGQCVTRRCLPPELSLTTRYPPEDSIITTIRASGQHVTKRDLHAVSTKSGNQLHTTAWEAENAK